MVWRGVWCGDVVCTCSSRSMQSLLCFQFSTDSITPSNTTVDPVLCILLVLLLLGVMLFCVCCTSHDGTVVCIVIPVCVAALLLRGFSLSLLLHLNRLCVVAVALLVSSLSIINSVVVLVRGARRSVVGGVVGVVGAVVVVVAVVEVLLNCSKNTIFSSSLVHILTRTSSLYTS